MFSFDSVSPLGVMDRLNLNNSVLFACEARILRVFAPVPIFIGFMAFVDHFDAMHLRNGLALRGDVFQGIFELIIISVI
jgi:hypothetical protein